MISSSSKKIIWIEISDPQWNSTSDQWEHQFIWFNLIWFQVLKIWIKSFGLKYLIRSGIVHRINESINLSTDCSQLEHELVTTQLAKSKYLISDGIVPLSQCAIERSAMYQFLRNTYCGYYVKSTSSHTIFWMVHWYIWVAMDLHNLSVNESINLSTGA